MCAWPHEPLDGPADQSEQPQFLACRRIDGQAVRVVRLALGAAHFVRVAIAPHRALAQQPVRHEPPAGEYQRRPPGKREENDGRGEAADHPDESAGDEVHRVRQRRSGHTEIEVTRYGEVARQPPHPRGVPSPEDGTQASVSRSPGPAAVRSPRL